MIFDILALFWFSVELELFGCPKSYQSGKFWGIKAERPLLTLTKFCWMDLSPSEKKMEECQIIVVISCDAMKSNMCVVHQKFILLNPPPSICSSKHNTVSSDSSDKSNLSNRDFKIVDSGCSSCSSARFRSSGNSHLWVIVKIWLRLAKSYYVDLTRPQHQVSAWPLSVLDSE